MVVTFEQRSLQKSTEVAKFDLMLRFVYNPTLDDGKLSYRLVCSRDLFDEKTAVSIARRFERFLSRIFCSNISTSENEHLFPSLKQLSLILPEEAYEIQDVLFLRQQHVLNEGMFFFQMAFSVLFYFET